jgi:predicted patatin/cPLA2 family phospholipase
MSDVDQKILGMVKKAALASGEVFPDGVSQPWWGRTKAKAVIWTRNFIIYNAYYRSEDVFPLIIFDKKIGEIKTPFGASVVLADPAMTVHVCNRESEWVDPSREPYSWFDFTGEHDAWKVAAYTSAIPFMFYCPKYLGCDPVDGAASSNLPYEYMTDKNIFSFSTLITPTAKKPKPPKINWSRAWMIGPVVRAYKTVMLMLKDKTYDQVAGFLDAPCGHWRGIVELPCSKIRREAGKKLGRKKVPTWMQFSEHDAPLVSALIDGGYSFTKQWIEEGGISEKRLKKLADEGLSLAITGGGADGYIELGGIAALWVILHNINPQPPFNYLAGASAGGINAMFFAWLQDSFYGEVMSGETIEQV